MEITSQQTKKHVYVCQFANLFSDSLESDSSDYQKESYSKVLDHSSTGCIECKLVSNIIKDSVFNGPGKNHKP